MEPSSISLTIAFLSILSSTCALKVGFLPETLNQKYTTGLFWDYANSVLYFVDRTLNEIHRLNIFTTENQYITLDELPTFVIPTKDYDQRFVIGKKTNIEYLFWPYDSPGGYFAECLIVTVDSCCPGNALNDGKADPYGKLWIATDPIPNSNLTFPLNMGSLFRFDLTVPGKAGVAAVLTHVSFGNDVSWTRDYNIFYFVESYSGCIYSFNYDLVNGAICCGQIIFCLADHNITGKPDGMTVDWNDNLWIAAPGSGMVLNINPITRELIKTVQLPAKYVIDVAFGGLNLEILFVSSRDVGDPTDKNAGSIFLVEDLGVYGRPENYAVMNSDCTPQFFT